MKPYADTNFYTRFYLGLPEHRQAVKLLEEARRREAALLPITWLHRVEVINAIQLHVFAARAVGQSRITPEQAAAAQVNFRADLEAAQFLDQVSLPLGTIEAQFESLALRHTARHGFRTYDLLHVSAAILLQSDTFWSFDPKAQHLAELEGLIVEGSKRPET